VRKHIIGHQHALLLAIIGKCQPITPPDIAVEWEIETGDKIPRGSLYPALRLLESRKLIKSRLVRGGRTYPHPQRAFKLPKRGGDALAAYMNWAQIVGRHAKR
jgi:DNA-binding PadR family transcriptional regulator